MMKVNNTLAQMLIATSLYVVAQVAMGHPVMEEGCVYIEAESFCPGQEEYADAVREACISDMWLDWENPMCDRFRPEGDMEVAGVVIVYDPDEDVAKPIVVIGGD